VNAVMNLQVLAPRSQSFSHQSVSQSYNYFLQLVNFLFLVILKGVLMFFLQRSFLQNFFQ
jgi:hypothetical protein